MFCIYGTFIGNLQQQQVEIRCITKTVVLPIIWCIEMEERVKDIQPRETDRERQRQRQRKRVRVAAVRQLCVLLTGHVNMPICA